MWSPANGLWLLLVSLDSHLVSIFTERSQGALGPGYGPLGWDRPLDELRFRSFATCLKSLLERSVGETGLSFSCGHWWELEGYLACSTGRGWWG